MKSIFLVGAALVLGATSAAQAAVIVAPVTVSVTSGGTVGSFWTVDNVIDQSGLTRTYIPGVTDFDAFVAEPNRHSGALNTEWFSGRDSRSAQLTFDFGQEVTLYKLAIWDENNSSQQSMSISTPALGLIRSFAPRENSGSPYPGGEVFEFRPITTRYLTLDITGCGTKPQFNSVDYCGLGEIIFADGSGVGPVPEPATWALMIGGFGMAGAMLRRRQRLALA
ncbi:MULTISPECIES: PEPxxWA-CTERM sorting domain-containing protein [unclassified Phenylobacterium]|uniref:PEPxxWA-CTERM sorting domain-containing protein n=1 Tax=unclassified Phenylobacterium TaxID=2640670 RepID=UPI00083ADD8E|nr:MULTISPECIES: PEPxxWA-CTERM sorting domain-containing protein [unclassified Phenylobacterium]